VVSEEEGLRQARTEGKPAMIDFWASWCVACMEFEKITYADPEVIKELKKFVNIKIDCTNSSDPKIKQLWEKYGIVGLPTIVFIDKDGNIIKDKTITGFVNAQEFVHILQGL
jgi:thiol:disulfide interchange protein DsbD